MKAKLLITTEEPRTETMVDLDPHREHTIGRSLQCLVPIADRKLSRIHCSVMFQKDHFYLKDHQSTNGTFLNKQTVQKLERLQNGDVIKIGSTHITFVFERGTEELPKKDDLVDEPKQIDQYEVLEKIGQGGIGSVYKVRHSKNQEVFALKLLKPEAAQDNAMVTRFYQEARACATLNHPALVKVHDIGIYEEAPYLVLEFVPGSPLSSIIRSEKRLAVPVALSIAAQVAEALVYAHAKGIVHRDIKPGNILVSTETKVKIVDMGMVKMIHESGITLSGQTMGTPRYMPPEQIEDASKVNHQVDIYALGATLYFMVAGVPPYHELRTKHLGELLKHIVTTPPVPVESLVELTPAVAKLIARSMERDPKKRIPDAKTLVKEIQNVLKHI